MSQGQLRSPSQTSQLSGWSIARRELVTCSVELSNNLVLRGELTMACHPRSTRSRCMPSGFITTLPFVGGMAVLAHNKRWRRAGLHGSDPRHSATRWGCATDSVHANREDVRNCCPPTDGLLTADSSCAVASLVVVVACRRCAPLTQCRDTAARVPCWSRRRRHHQTTS